MSQYPYQPPPQMPYGYGSYSQDPMRVLLAPAKRASIIMLILSGLMIPCGLLMGLVSTMDLAQLSNDPSLQIVEQQLASVGWSISGFFKIFAALLIIPGILLLIFGVIVRKGGLGSVICSIILCCVLGLFGAFGLFSGIVQSSQGNGQALIGAVVWGVVLVLLVFILVFLFQAAKNSGMINSHRMSNQAQMHQYQQQSQIYNPSQHPQAWQQPAPGQWPQPGWPPQQPPPPQQQNWPPPPSNPG